MAEKLTEGALMAPPEPDEKYEAGEDITAQVKAAHEADAEAKAAIDELASGEAETKMATVDKKYAPGEEITEQVKAAHEKTAIDNFQANLNLIKKQAAGELVLADELEAAQEAVNQAVGAKEAQIADLQTKLTSINKPATDKYVFADDLADALAAAGGNKEKFLAAAPD